MSTGSDRLDSIQVLRGVAAMAVVFNHAGLLVLAHATVLGASFLIPAEAVVRLGAAGVDLFFVISGFVMALSATKFAGARGAVVFLLHRYNRIAPLYYLFSLVMLADRLRAGVETDRAVILNSFGIIPFFDGPQYSWTLHYLGWTLAFEFVFYLFVAIMVVVGAGRRAGWLLALMAAVPFAGFAFTRGDIAWVMFTNPILWEFALGIGAYMLWRRGLLARLRTPLLWAALASLALFAVPFVLYPETADPLNVGATVHATMALERAFFWGVPSFLVFCAVIARDGEGSPPRTGLARLIGDASYSLYLSHLLVMIVSDKVVASLPAGVLPVGTADLVLLLLLAVSAWVGILVYRWAEKPMLVAGQRLLRNRFEQPPRAPDVPQAQAVRRRVRSEWEV
jgi:exopolysaccharide production protein ExoZ